MKTASWNMEREAKKRFEIMTGKGRDVTLQKLPADWTREILYSLRVRVVLVLQSRTHFLCSKAVLEYSKEEPALQCRRQSARWTRHH